MFNIVWFDKDHKRCTARRTSLTVAKKLPCRKGGQVLDENGGLVDCLSCSDSFSADDKDGNHILMCVCDPNNHCIVPENGYCENWK